MDETSQAISSIDTIEIENCNEDGVIESKEIKFSDIVLEEVTTRKERKGSSYVWNYCDKLSRNTVRCKLCSKVMSFHGTANVITHLQRKHNILGKLDENNTSVEHAHVDLNVTEETPQADKDNNKEDRPNRRSVNSMSVVWKYCTRVDKDTVRCDFCNKNLSYQGTSNLQRHLHRMHGVATQSRLIRQEPVGEYDGKMLSPDLIWEHYVIVDDAKVKCNMCNNLFDNQNMETLSRHLAVTHSVLPPKNRLPSQRLLKRCHSGDDSSEEYDNYENDNWGNSSKYEERGGSVSNQFEENNMKKDDLLYDDIIEEEHDQTNFDEDPFNPQEQVVDNPLSPQSSLENSPERKVSSDSKRLEKLKEELVRMETEYFKEKAGYYRMQKYLSALQAKKIRLEVERMHSGTATYTMELDNMHQ